MYKLSSVRADPGSYESVRGFRARPFYLACWCLVFGEVAASWRRLLPLVHATHFAAKGLLVDLCLVDSLLFPACHIGLGITQSFVAYGTVRT